MIPEDPGLFGFGIATFLVVGVSLCLGVAHLTRLPWSGRIALLTFSAHLLVSTVAYGTVGLYANDAVAYDSTGLSIAQRLGGDPTATVDVSHGKEGWVWLLGYLYHWFGHEPYLGLILNALFAALIVPLVGLITARLGWENAARRAMWLAGFAPPLFVWSTFLLREPAINFLTSVAVAGAVLFLARRRYRWLILTGAAGYGLYWLRGTVTVVLIAGLLIGIVMVGRLGNHKMRARQAFLLLVVAVFSVPVALKVLGTFNVNFDSINASRAALARTAHSSFGSVSSSSGTFGSARIAVEQLPSAMLGPFPWQWAGGLGGLLTALDAVTWWVLLYYVWRAWRTDGVRRGRWILAAPALILFLAVALTSGNYGTLVRIRAMNVPVVAPLVAVGMLTPRVRRKRQQRRSPARPVPVSSRPPKASRSTSSATSRTTA